MRKNKIKFIVLDIDDTIIGKSRDVSAPVKKAITAAQDKGVQFTLASGRMHKTMKRIAADLNITKPLISCNGALVRDDERVLLYECIEDTVAKSLIDFFDEKNLSLQLYRTDGLYSRDYCERTWLLEKYEGLDCTIIDDNEYKGFCSDLLKQLIRLDNGNAFEYLHLIEDKFVGKVSAAISHNVYLEMTAFGVNKGKALENLAAFYGYKPSEVLAIGDSLNDVQMLEWAGTAIAMGNALDTVKKVCDDVTLPVGEDGVAAAIEKYIL